jgi:uroporphyrin-III C-methyltransferase/precorrin-2 dehydrogenase/sirohydrochlorin ferrochelatase
VIHGAGVPVAILDRARADAARLPAPGGEGPGLTVRVEMA